jgi:hypothetical protein
VKRQLSELAYNEHSPCLSPTTPRLFNYFASLDVYVFRRTAIIHRRQCTLSCMLSRVEVEAYSAICIINLIKKTPVTAVVGENPQVYDIVYSVHCGLYYYSVCVVGGRLVCM